MKNKIGDRIIIVFIFPFILFTFFLFFSCKSGSGSSDNSDDKTTATTPVTVTTCTIGAMNDEVTLNATSAFLQKNYIKATLNGYITAVNTQLGQKVESGQNLFTIKAKEAANIGSTINKLDTAFHFTGVVKVATRNSGYITHIDHQLGDYVQEGDQLAEISDTRSLVFLLQLPYELRPYLSENKLVNLLLPDGRLLKGSVSSAMPSVDPVSQTQEIVINITNNVSIPENLIAKVKIIKSSKKNAISLPKAAILTDETQENFWIMKMIDKKTAVKVPIKKGMETQERVEILSPTLTSGDLILETGNYGLPDTATVVIEK